MQHLEEKRLGRRRKTQFLTFEIRQHQNRWKHSAGKFFVSILSIADNLMLSVCSLSRSRDPARCAPKVLISFVSRIFCVLLNVLWYGACKCSKRRDPDVAALEKSEPPRFGQRILSKATSADMTHEQASRSLFRMRFTYKHTDVPEYKYPPLMAFAFFLKSVACICLYLMAHYYVSVDKNIKDNLQRSLVRLKKVECAMRKSEKFSNVAPVMHEFAEIVSRAISNGLECGRPVCVPQEYLDPVVLYYSMMAYCHGHWRSGLHNDHSKASEMAVLGNYVSGQMGAIPPAFFFSRTKLELHRWAADLLVCESLSFILMDNAHRLQNIDDSRGDLIRRLRRIPVLKRVSKMATVSRFVDDKICDANELMFDIAYTGSMDLVSSFKDWEHLSIVHWALTLDSIEKVDDLRRELNMNMMRNTVGDESEKQKASLLPLVIMGLVRIEGDNTGLFSNRYDTPGVRILRMRDRSMKSETLSSLGFFQTVQAGLWTLGVPYTMIAYRVRLECGKFRTKLLCDTVMKPGKALQPGLVFDSQSCNSQRT